MDISSVRRRALRLTDCVFEGVEFRNSKPSNAYLFVEMYEWFYRYIAIRLVSNCIKDGCVLEDFICSNCHGTLLEIIRTSRRKYFPSVILRIREFTCALLISLVSVLIVRLRSAMTNEKCLGIFSLDSPAKDKIDFRFESSQLELTKNFPNHLFLVNQRKSVFSDFVKKRKPCIYINSLSRRPFPWQSKGKVVHSFGVIEDLLNQFEYCHENVLINSLLRLSRVRVAFVQNLSQRTAIAMSHLKIAGCRVVGSQHAASMPIHSPTEFLNFDLNKRFGSGVFGPDIMGAWGLSWKRLLMDSGKGLYGEVILIGPIRAVGEFEPRLLSRGSRRKRILVIDEQLADQSEVCEAINSLRDHEITIKVRPGGESFLMSTHHMINADIQTRLRLNYLPVSQLPNSWDLVLCTYSSAGLELASRGFEVAYLKTKSWGDAFEIGSRTQIITNLRLVEKTEDLNKTLAEVNHGVDYNFSESNLRRDFFCELNGAKRLSELVRKCFDSVS